MAKAKNSKAKAKETATRRVRGSSARTVYESLRRDILTMALPPGQPLDEVQIGERYNLSRSPVREALIRLSSEELVQTLPNKSTIVTPLNIQELPRYLDALDLMQRTTTRLAALLRTDADLKVIKQRQRAFQSALDKSNALDLIQTNRDFHIAISEAGKNRYFTSLYTRLLDEGLRMLRIYFSSYGDSLPPELEGEHAAIIEAIEARDADLAERLAHEHAVQVGDRYAAFLTTRFTADISLTP